MEMLREAVRTATSPEVADSRRQRTTWTCHRATSSLADRRHRHEACMYRMGKVA
jgi:hypothetical protein